MWLGDDGSMKLYAIWPQLSPSTSLEVYVIFMTTVALLSLKFCFEFWFLIITFRIGICRSLPIPTSPHIAHFASHKCYAPLHPALSTCKSTLLYLRNRKSICFFYLMITWLVTDFHQSKKISCYSREPTARSNTVTLWFSSWHNVNILTTLVYIIYLGLYLHHLFFSTLSVVTYLEIQDRYSLGCDFSLCVIVRESSVCCLFQMMKSLWTKKS